MDLVVGVSRVIVVMEHVTRAGSAKFKPKRELPLISTRCQRANASSMSAAGLAGSSRLFSSVPVIQTQ
jgi:acyl CoA:acetate/3-ketoacid CoA transferase beta subunit